MTFFYDLNKKMADLATKQQLTETAAAAPAPKSKLTEAAADYSATKARAGKDIGKPGKNFSKIAAGAAKRYGSAEAGKRVAGAVLNKLRHPTKEGIMDVVKTGVKKAVGTGMALGAVGESESSKGGATSLSNKKSSKNMDEVAKYRNPKYKDRLYTQEPLDYTYGPDADELYYNPKPDDYAGRKRPMGGGEFSHNDPLRKGFGRGGASNSINTHLSLIHI